MTKKKKIIKRIFAFVGVLSILFCMVLPFSVGATTGEEGNKQINYFSLGVLSDADVKLSAKTTLEEVRLDLDRIVLKTGAGAKEDGMLRFDLSLSDLMPYAEVGETYVLKMEISNDAGGLGIANGISVGYGSKDNPNPTYWGNGKARTLTQQDLDGLVTFYGYNSKSGGVPSADVYTTMRIAVVPEGLDYFFDYTKEEINYKNGYADGFEEGKAAAYEEAKKYAYQEYLNKNTIVNPATTSVTFIWSAHAYESSFDECPVGTVDYFDYPVYLSYMDNNDYDFDGYSFSTSALSRADYGFDGDFIGRDDLYMSGLKGVSIFVSTKNNGVYACAGDLPIQLNFGSPYYINSSVIEAYITYTVPAGYSVPANAILMDGVYVCSAKVLKGASDANGAFSCTAQELFGLDASTPVISMRVTFVCGKPYSSGFADGAGIIISNTKNNPAFMAGVSYGSSEGYIEGYGDGKADGLALGKTDGYNIGFKEGKIVAYNQGYSDGLKTAKELTFRGLMFAVVDAPVQVFSSVLNFEVLGINLLGFMTSILTVMIVIAVVKVVVKFT